MIIPCAKQIQTVLTINNLVQWRRELHGTVQYVMNCLTE